MSKKLNKKNKKKLLVIGREGRLMYYTEDKDAYNDYQISYVPMRSSEEEMLAAGRDADFVLVDAMGEVPGNVIRQMPNLKLIHSEGVGYQGVDLAAASERGIPVCNCRGMNAAAVAEQAVLLMLGLLRDIAGGDRKVREGQQIQTKEAYMLAGNLRELGECTVGLLGFGAIAKATARLLTAFGARILYWSRTRASAETEAEYHAEYRELDALLAESDIVSLHLPVTDATRYIADDPFFRKMKADAFLVNTARGELVDSEALIRALLTGEIAGAGLDTIDGEPVSRENPLCQAPPEAADKLLLSCHIGGITGASFRRGYAMILANFERVNRGEEPIHRVN